MNEQKTIEEILSERFSEKQVSDWKKQYAPRKVGVIVVEDKIAVIRPIGAAEVANYSMMVVNPDIGMAKASEYLLDELWIDGDSEIRNDEEYFISAMMQIQKTANLKKSSFFQL